MAKTSLPRTPSSPKGSGLPVAHPPKGLTLADVTVVRRVLDKEMVRISGPELAKLIDATQPEGDGRPPLVDRGSIWEELTCLADLVQVIGAADRAGIDFSIDKPLYWVGETLKKLANRVMALQPSGNNAPNWYAVEVKK
jgi:hypothetical protein